MNRRPSKPLNCVRVDREKSAPRRARSGFSLLELLIVIVVIGVLAALLLPAIRGAVQTAREAAVRAEISQLESAIAQFKAQYGIEPPSGITIYTTQMGWDSSPASKAIVQRMWPNFNFGGAVGVEYPSGWGASHTLTGAECIVFFLGGIVDAGVPQGFSKNPTAPFAPPSPGEVRQGPFFEFNPGRTRNPPFMVYRDPLPGQTEPYVYLSSYEGRGYNAADIPASTITDFYRVAAGGAAHKPKGFQIISPGVDGTYGAGGAYVAGSPNAGLANAADYDNITNLTSGRLNP